MVKGGLFLMQGIIRLFTIMFTIMAFFIIISVFPLLLLLFFLYFTQTHFVAALDGLDYKHYLPACYFTQCISNAQ